MARPSQEAIDTFISITSCTQSVAIQRLVAHNGNLNRAINAHFSEGDRNTVQGAPTPATQNSDLMDVDDPLEIETRAPSSLFPGQTLLNSFSPLDPEFRNRLFDRSSLFNETTESMGPTPYVSHSREVRQIPIEVRDGNVSSTHSGHGPTIVDVTDTEHSQGPEIRGSVTINDDDDDDFGNVPNVHAHHRSSAPEFDAIQDDHNDTEEEIIRAAIEASKKDAELQMHHELDRVGPQQRQPQLEDAELAHAISMPLKTVEGEQSSHDQSLVSRDSESSAYRPIEVDELGNARHGYGNSDKFIRGQQKKEAASSSAAQDEVKKLGERPLVGHRSRNRSGASGDPHQESGGNEAVHPVGSSEHNVAVQSQVNGNAFPSHEWGGISSEEHDEAVMLEAAMFGGIPEQSGYNFPYGPHQLLRSGVDRTWQAPRPPSPGLAAQRLIREQQDVEYLASLQADREKELKAMEEERAAKEAVLEEERRREEDAQRKFEEDQELERLLATKKATLPKEPAADDENAVTLLVRMPDGSRHGRRFLRSDKLQSLFDFIDIGRGVKPGSYRLVRPYPRQAFSDGESISTLNELGLMSKQEALFLEPI